MSTRVPRLLAFDIGRSDSAVPMTEQEIPPEKRWRLIEQHPWDIVVEVLKHEMAHQLADELLGGCESAHGVIFRDACRMLGVANWAAGAACDLPQEIPNWRQRVLTSEEVRLP